MNLRLREYRETDYEDCRSLWGELTQHHAALYKAPSIAGKDPGRGFDEYLGRADRCGTWVAENDGKIVGFAGLLDTVGEEGTGDVEPVVTRETFRGKGVGTRLIELVIDKAKEKGFRFLTIKPEVRNEQAFSLYVRLGFNHVGAIELFQDLFPKPERKWKSGLEIHGKSLTY